MPKASSQIWTKLVIISWLLLVISLLLPALSEFGVPNWALIAISVAGLFGRDGIGPPQLLLVGLGCFLATTVILWRRPRSVLGIFAFALILTGLLVVWLVPVLGGIEDRVGALGGFSEFRWGYYVYGLAHTLMFVSGIILITAPRPVGSNRGFPVGVPDEKAEPPRSA